MPSLDLCQMKTSGLCRVPDKVPCGKAGGGSAKSGQVLKGATRAQTTPFLDYELSINALASSVRRCACISARCRQAPPQWWLP